MFFRDSLTTAMEEVWQLALTMASLKYIMGTVTDEVTAASTGLEEDERLSHFDRKEASPEPHSHETPEKDIAQEEDQQSNKSFISSMATHLLSPIDNSIATTDSKTCVSLSSHMSSLTAESEGTDALSITSLVAHQLHVDAEESPTVDDNDFQTYLCHISDLEKEDSDESILTSMVCHQSSSLCLHDEPEVHSQSMVAHKHHTLALEDIEHTSLSSMVSHHTLTVKMREDLNQTELNSVIKVSDQEEYVDIVEGLHANAIENISSKPEKDNEIDIISEINFGLVHSETKKQTGDTQEFATETSITAHKLSNIDISEDLNVLPSSIIAHQHNLSYIEDSASLSSIGAHHIGSFTTSNNDYNDDLLHYCMYFSETEDEETTECTSIVSHQLPSANAPAEFKGFLSSMIAHTYQALEIEDSDTACLTSMVAHYIPKFGTTKLNDITDIQYDISLVNNLEEETQCASIVSHQLPFSDIPSEFKDFVPTMGSHNYQQLEVNDSDTASLPTMKTHQKPGVNDSEIEEMYDLQEYTSVCDIIDEETSECISIVSHQLTSMDVLDVFEDHITSMTAHNFHELILEDSDTASLSSMVAHHQLQFGEMGQEMTDALPQEYIDICDEAEEEATECISTVAHMLPASDIPSEYKEFLSSMTAHQCKKLVIEDLDTASLVSMVSHQIPVLNKSEDVVMFEFAQCYEYLTEDSGVSEECTKYTSSVSHQLPSPDIPDEPQTNLFSMTGHKHMEEEPMGYDTASLDSKVVHQIPTYDNQEPVEILLFGQEASSQCPAQFETEDSLSASEVFSQLIKSEEETSKKSQDNLEDYMVTMVAHQLPSVDDIYNEPCEPISTMVTHFHIPPALDDFDTASLPSMTAHQLNLISVDEEENPSNQTIKEEMGEENIANIDEEDQLETVTDLNSSKVGYQVYTEDISLRQENFVTIDGIEQYCEATCSRLDILDNYTETDEKYLEKAERENDTLLSSSVSNQVSDMDNNDEINLPPEQPNEAEESLPNHELSMRQCKVINATEFNHADQEELEKKVEVEESIENRILDDPRKIKPGSNSNTPMNFVQTEQNNGENSFAKDIEGTDIAINNEVEETYLMRMKRIKYLQQTVEDEIGNFKCRDYTNINKETVSTSNVTVVNGVEFPVVINLNQHDHINEDKNEQMKKEMYVEEELVNPIEEFECGQLEKDLSHEIRFGSFVKGIGSLDIISEESLGKRNEIYTDEEYKNEKINTDDMQSEQIEKQLSYENLVLEQANECIQQQYIMKTENSLGLERRNVEEIRNQLNKEEQSIDKYIEYEDHIDNHDLEDGSDENVVTASCILGDNEPVVITSSAFTSDKDSESSSDMGNKTDDEKLAVAPSQPDTQNESLKTHETTLEHQTKSNLNTKKSRCVNQDIQTREKELLHSFLNINQENEVKSSQTTLRENWKNTVDIMSKEENETILKQTKSQSKSSLTSNIGEHLKKRTFKIKFKVKIGKETHSNTKHSVLQYLFGCFGGQKLFNSLPQ